jgi:uncharacterized radical SAM protein YgiQ
MYGMECGKKQKQGACPDRSCLRPTVCRTLNVDHGKQLRLFRRLRALAGVKKVVVASGIRYDMILADRKNGSAFLQDLVRYHVSGQLKVAPEHTEDEVLKHMGKPGIQPLMAFKKQFDALCHEAGLPQFLSYYFMAAHPGCRLSHMKALKRFMSSRLRTRSEQVQIFTPTPSTYSTLMYYTGKDPFTGEPVYVERELRKKERQKAVLMGP